MVLYNEFDSSMVDESSSELINLVFEFSDFVLSDDLLTINPKNILNITINYTIINGKIVYSNL